MNIGHFDAGCVVSLEEESLHVRSAGEFDVTLAFCDNAFSLVEADSFAFGLSKNILLACSSEAGRSSLEVAGHILGNNPGIRNVVGASCSLDNNTNAGRNVCDRLQVNVLVIYQLRNVSLNAFYLAEVKFCTGEVSCITCTGDGNILCGNYSLHISQYGEYKSCNILPVVCHIPSKRIVIEVRFCSFAQRYLLAVLVILVGHALCTSAVDSGIKDKVVGVCSSAAATVIDQSECGTALYTNSSHNIVLDGRISVVSINQRYKTAGIAAVALHRSCEEVLLYDSSGKDSTNHTACLERARVDVCIGEVVADSRATCQITGNGSNVVTTFNIGVQHGTVLNHRTILCVTNEACSIGITVDLSVDEHHILDGCTVDVAEQTYIVLVGVLISVVLDSKTLAVECTFEGIVD